MRITRILFQYKHLGSKARIPQDPNKVPIQPILPMKLKNSVSGKVDTQKQVACLHEMSVLFASLKDNEFNEKSCKKEIEQLKLANIAAMNKAREDKMKNAGQIATTGYNLNPNQINRYLRKFPE